ncbi:hypothetical protein C1H46_028694 [Malus baccata]|uniref:Uncharacterized protein n=1 Tax=Malus baccata TaxID=106549 RepID=A0A540LH30_MALBA|nr:hypothetical protein C1H46_028694 [Malus baccata]
MGTTRKWFRTIRRKLVRSSNRYIIVVYTNTTPSTHEESSRYEELEDITSSSSSFEKRIFTKEDIAAIVSSTEEPGEAAGVGSWSVCAETGTYSSALHGLNGSVAGQGSHTAATQHV